MDCAYWQEEAPGLCDALRSEMCRSDQSDSSFYCRTALPIWGANLLNLVLRSIPLFA